MTFCFMRAYFTALRHEKQLHPKHQDTGPYKTSELFSCAHNVMIRIYIYVPIFTLPVSM